MTNQKKSSAKGKEKESLKHIKHFSGVLGDITGIVNNDVPYQTDILTMKIPISVP
jgi:hypothetical protein